MSDDHNNWDDDGGNNGDDNWDDEGEWVQGPEVPACDDATTLARVILEIEWIIAEYLDPSTGRDAKTTFDLILFELDLNDAIDAAWRTIDGGDDVTEEEADMILASKSIKGLLAKK